MIEVFNWFTDKLSYVIGAILSVLPESPFVALARSDEINQVLRWLNWFIPVGEMVAILEAWLVAITVVYVYLIILRWAKAVE